MPHLGLDLDKVNRLFQQELQHFGETHPNSHKAYQQNLKHWLYGAPLHWMQQWPGLYPIMVQEANGCTILDIDKKQYVDFALGDTGAMFGHAQPAVVEAISQQIRKGSTFMLPTEDSIWVGEELARRFKLPYWQVTTSATDANRFVIRLCRMITNRQKIIVFNGNYHGSVDETQVELDQNGKMVAREGVYHNAVNHDNTTGLVEFNDLVALEKALSQGNIAAVLTEPFMTNVGMVPPTENFHQQLRALTKKFDVPLIIDETHTISCGPSGYTGEHNLQPDFFVLGKCIAGGIPTAVWGSSAEMAERIWQVLPHFKAGEAINHFGFGGTLAGNALQIAGMRATFSQVMTAENYQHMFNCAKLAEQAIVNIITHHQLPWHVTRIGARLEYLFMNRAPLDGGEAHHARHSLLEAYLHLYLLNRGVLLTPFHNMLLMCPATQVADIELHNKLLDESITAAFN